MMPNFDLNPLVYMQDICYNKCTIYKFLLNLLYHKKEVIVNKNYCFFVFELR